MHVDRYLWLRHVLPQKIWKKKCKALQVRIPTCYHNTYIWCTKTVIRWLYMSSKRYVFEEWLRPATWLYLCMRELSPSVRHLSTAAWWGLVWPKHILYSVWLCYRLTAFIQGDLVQWVFMHVDPLSSFRVTSHSPVSLQQSDRPILLLRRLTADIYCSRQWRVSGTWQTHDLCIKSGTIPLYDSVYWSRQILCILILLFKLTQLLLRLTIWMKSSILCLYAYIHLFTTALNCTGLPTL